MHEELIADERAYRLVELVRVLRRVVLCGRGFGSQCVGLRNSRGEICAIAAGKADNQRAMPKSLAPASGSRGSITIPRDSEHGRGRKEAVRSTTATMFSRLC